MRKLFNLCLLFCAGLALAAPPATAYVNPTQERESYEANQRGVRQLDQGHLDEAIKEFERAHRLNPENKIISDNLGVCYNNLAVSLMQDKRFLEAKRYLEKAAELRPEDKSIQNNLLTAHNKTGGALGTAPDIRPPAAPRTETDAARGQLADDFLMQGIQHFEKKEYDLAREALMQSIQYSSQNPTAYEVLGDIAYQEQDLKTAKDYYVHSYRLRRTKVLEEKIEKLNKERPVEEKLDQYSDEHFIIRYKKELSGFFGGGPELRDMLREAWRTVSQDFGYYPHEKVVILLYSEKEYRELSSTPAWTAGHFDGKIRLPAYKERSDMVELKKLVYHELTHFFILNLSGARCPTWLNEGLAQYQENKVKPIQPVAFDTARDNGVLLNLDALGRGISDDMDAGSVLLFYQESFKITTYLIENYKMFKIKQMLGLFKQGKTVDEVFKEALQISVKGFERQWAATLKNS